MIIEIVSFERPPGFSDDDIIADARSVADHWRTNPDLIRKHFATNADGDVAGIYLWPDKDAALKAHDASWIARFQARTSYCQIWCPGDFHAAA